MANFALFYVLIFVWDFQIFRTACVAKNFIRKIMNTMAFNWPQNMVDILVPKTVCFADVIVFYIQKLIIMISK